MRDARAQDMQFASVGHSLFANLEQTQNEADAQHRIFHELKVSSLERNEMKSRSRNVHFSVRAFRQPNHMAAHFRLNNKARSAINNEIMNEFLEPSKAAHFPERRVNSVSVRRKYRTIVL